MRHTRLPFLLALVALALPASAAAEVAQHYTPAEAEVVFRTANEACMREDYEVCVEGYERLLAAGFGGADLAFNLGTARLRQGRIGWAVLHLERALRLDPGDDDARANLERARRMRVDKIVGSPEEAAGSEPIASRIVFHTRGPRWTLGFLLLWTVGWGLVLLRRFAQSGGRRGVMFAVGLLGIVAALPCALVTAAHVYVNESARDAIVVAAALPVREGPDSGIKPTFEIHEGLKVRILDRDGAFQRIRLSNGLQGWVPVDGAVEISPG